MDQKYKLELIGITFNQIESGVYALILQQTGTNRRIPIIIGFPEAQAIECKLQEIKTPRPLTHDIMIESLKAFGIKLVSVLIKRLPNGVFAADLQLTDGEKEIIIDARSSDAVALAIRANAPIYTTEDVLREASFDPSDRKKRFTPQGSSEQKQEESKTNTESKFDSMTIEQLSEAMMKAAESENYEEAARIKSIIDLRQNGENPEKKDI